MRLAAIPIVGATLLAAHAQAAVPNMKEGLWETTTKMEMPGLPANMPPQTVKRCITKKDLADSAKAPPGAEMRDSRCKITDYKLQGNTASWKTTCEGENAMTGTGTVTYSGTSYSGKQIASIKQGGQTQNMTMEFAGKHVGDCK
jgi:uncharacterized protein DUF3617